MSPILVRPVREQLEHDRVIRLLQAKYKRRFDAGINPGASQTVPVGVGASAVYPDLVLTSLERGHRLEAVIEVETGESVNHLEALAQWSHFAKLRAPFHLYVPSSMVDVARRLCEDNQIQVNEIWSFHGIGEDIRFTMVHRSREAAAAVQRRPAPAAPPARAPRAAATRTRKPAAARPAKRPARPAKAAAARKTSRKPARATKRR